MKLRFHPDVLAAHKLFGGDIEGMQRRYNASVLKHCKPQPVPSELDPVALEAARAAKDAMYPLDGTEAAICAYLAKMHRPAVARAHITMENGAPYPDIDLEVLDGASLQPEMSPVLLYASPVPVMVTDAMVDAAAKAMHDGPLGGDDEAEYTSDEWNRPAEWCRDMARAALTAALTPQAGGENERA
ncbi:hypothetical protein [Mesorhizobium sp.]|uniref:hypothetical protein n=1 Tax=Mesorhizobium sp. TaxID=1871066 RepID=UPI000FE34902|nr:hypothetical protein [Mesorhizobium sp.]RWI35538.1 MAG: hypothetical protein EOR14_28975 [Mesorhizobium sp.]RWJ03474.1 MAG: hypothetical protein EOR24_32355 [Mesorhizobium sp.]RWJ66293.1 MAG: hypothetical protein EOR34_28160 [Mesorhizobium sp.]